MGMKKMLNEGNQIHNFTLCLLELLIFSFITVPVPVLFRQKVTVQVSSSTTVLNCVFWVGFEVFAGSGFGIVFLIHFRPL
jgi:hypothetical protein